MRTIHAAGPGAPHSRSALAVLGFVSLTVSAPVLTAEGSPLRPVMAQKQLVSRTNCDTAAQALAKPDFLSKSVEFRDDVQITTRYCSATAHNQVASAHPQIVVVAADPEASGKHKISIRTIAQRDTAKVHEACMLAARATVAYAQATAAQPGGEISGADVVGDSGKVDCEAFLRATPAENPLVVLTPAALTGTAISVAILDMIAKKKPAAEVQAALDGLGHQLAGSIAMSADEMRRHPQIIAGAEGPNVHAPLR